MKVIIDIPKEEYGIIKNYKSFMPWAERLIKKGVAIPEGATNGDVVMAIFKEIQYYSDGKISASWWNAPYKGDN